MVIPDWIQNNPLSSACCYTIWYDHYWILLPIILFIFIIPLYLSLEIIVLLFWTWRNNFNYDFLPFLCILRHPFTCWVCYVKYENNTLLGLSFQFWVLLTSNKRVGPAPKNLDIGVVNDIPFSMVSHIHTSSCSLKLFANEGELLNKLYWLPLSKNPMTSLHIIFSSLPSPQESCSSFLLPNSDSDNLEWCSDKRCLLFYKITWIPWTHNLLHNQS